MPVKIFVIKNLIELEVRVETGLGRPVKPDLAGSSFSCSLEKVLQGDQGKIVKFGPSGGPGSGLGISDPFVSTLRWK